MTYCHPTREILDDLIVLLFVVNLLCIISPELSRERSEFCGQDRSLLLWPRFRLPWSTKQA
jgi:hypothetical protein